MKEASTPAVKDLCEVLVFQQNRSGKELPGGRGELPGSAAQQKANSCVRVYLGAFLSAMAFLEDLSYCYHVTK